MVPLLVGFALVVIGAVTLLRRRRYRTQSRGNQGGELPTPAIDRVAGYAPLMVIVGAIDIGVAIWFLWL